MDKETSRGDVRGMSRKGIEFTIDVEEITDYEKFDNNKELIKELHGLVDGLSYDYQIGFTDDNVLRCCR